MNLGSSDIFQDILRNSNCLELISVGIRVVDLRIPGAPLRVKVARLDNDTTTSEHVATTLISRIDSSNLVARSITEAQ